MIFYNTETSDAQELYAMKLLETLIFHTKQCQVITVLRVPGGWIFSEVDFNSGAEIPTTKITAFVPWNENDKKDQQ